MLVIQDVGCNFCLEGFVITPIVTDDRVFSADAFECTKHAKELMDHLAAEDRIKGLETTDAEFAQWVIYLGDAREPVRVGPGDYVIFVGPKNDQPTVVLAAAAKVLLKVQRRG
jgi:CRISPR/Cas system-associated protein endoribonuclease Cas2